MAKSIKSVCVLLTGILFGCSTAMGERIDIPSYVDVIDRAVTHGGSDRRVELRRCIRHWSGGKLPRGDIFESLLSERRSSEGPIAILEIGNSGHPRYDYVYIQGTNVKSSFAALTTEAEIERVRAFVDTLHTYDLKQLEGSAWSNIDDGDCYFLTISTGEAVKQVAVYADLDSTASGRLIRDMLESIAPDK